MFPNNINRKYKRNRDHTNKEREKENSGRMKNFAFGKYKFFF